MSPMVYFDDLLTPLIWPMVYRGGGGGGWVKEKASSSLLLLFFVQHILLLILVSLFLNEGEVGDNKATMTIMRWGGGLGRKKG